ncbi:MAG: P-loop NTPase [archaeon]
MKKIIGIISGKGGVGKTTLTSNIALALHNYQEEVIAIDVDLKNPTLGFHLGVKDYDVTISDVLNDNYSIYEALHIHPTGLKYFPASLSISHLNTDLTKLKELIDDMKGYVILDSPPGLSQDVFHILNASTDILVVTTPDLPSLAGCLRTLELARYLKKNVLGVVLNKVESKRYEIDPLEIEALCNTKILGIIPLDQSVTESLLKEIPLIHYKPFSPASMEITKIAAYIAGKKYKKPSLLRRWFWFK